MIEIRDLVQEFNGANFRLEADGWHCVRDRARPLAVGVGADQFSSGSWGWLVDEVSEQIIHN